VSEWFDHANQLWLLVTSMAAVWCVARADRWHRWGFVAGLASEPSYLYTSWVSGQWGIFLLTLWWTWYWGVGAWRRFGKDAA
jgi:hypothetical protein